MVNFDIVVPQEYQYLSNWSDFDSIMPRYADVVVRTIT